LGVTQNQKQLILAAVKTTVDIPDKELAEAMRFTGAKTKKEAINVAVAEYNRRRRAEEIIGLFGSFKSLMTNDEIEALDDEATGSKSR
jgi:Arc/MetJ family transcription regulator